jgi:ABC-type Mn2+/Zn2+ transport system permease subunit
MLRRIIFVGIALAQFSSLGLAVAAYFQQDYLIFSLLFTIAGVVLMAPGGLQKKIPPASIVGVGFAFAWALSILVLSKAAHGDADLLTLMKGNILGATLQDIQALALVLLPLFLIHMIFFKEFLYVSFDPDMACTQHVPVRFWNGLFYLTLGTAIAFSMKLAGVLLTFSYFLFPAAASLIIAQRIRLNLIICVIASVIASFTGVVISYTADLPTGPCIVAVLSALFFLAWLASQVSARVRLR